MMGNFLPESFYRDKLAVQLNGKTEVQTPSGRIDILTATQVIEVKSILYWKEAVGQVLSYGIYHPSKSKRIHFIGKPEKICIEVCAAHAIEVTWEAVIQLDNLASKGCIKKIKLSQSAVETAFREAIDFELNKVNQWLKDSEEWMECTKAGCQALIKNGGLLYISAFLPIDDSENAEWVRQIVPTDLRANIVNIQKTKSIAGYISALVALDRFTWKEYERIVAPDDFEV